MSITKLAQSWKELIVGQDHAIDKITPYIIRAQANLNAPNRPVGVFFLMGPTGTGKALPLDEMIVTPEGSLHMGDLKIGTKITGDDGHPTTVEAIYPQGIVDIYQITFADGRTVECCGEHLWKVYNKHWVPKPTYKIMSLLDIKSFIEKKRELHIPLCLPVAFPEKALPIDPYLLGALLGDGSLGKCMSFTNTDAFVISTVGNKLMAIGAGLVDYVNEERSCEYGIVLNQNTHTQDESSIRFRLREMDLFGKLSHEKFVPSIYKTGSIEQRLALLQGLMDTDGTAGKNGTISFSSVSKQLAQDVQELVWSLGGYAKISPKTSYYVYKGVRQKGRPAFTVNIRIEQPENLFKIEEKRRRALKNQQYRNRLRLKIINVSFVGKKPAQCITVDNTNSLYLTRNYVVTHNTKTAESLAELLHGNDRQLLRVDCGEYQMEHEVAKMIGAPPGYLGHKETQPLFTQKKLIDLASDKSGFTIILFDEIEKAHPGVWRAILSILDKAQLRLGDNNIVNFEKCIIFLSSNVGAQEINNILEPNFGFGEAHAANYISDTQQKAIEKVGLGAMGKKFPPEFSNRVDEIITYRSLDHTTLSRITDMELRKIQAHIHERLGGSAFLFAYGQETVEFLTTAGTSIKFGARELKRSLARYILNPLADDFVEGKIEAGSLVTCHVVDDHIEWDISSSSLEPQPEMELEVAAAAAESSITVKKTRRAKTTS